MNSVNNTYNLLDYVTITLSLIAILISGFTAWFACKANELSKKANKTSEEVTRIANGEVELAIGNSIRSTQQRVSDVAIKIAEIEECKTISEGYISELRKIYYQAVEANLNAYDEACALYRDKKIDTERFKKNYHSSIKALVEDNELKGRYFDSLVSRYECILEVYNEWNKFEN